MFGVKVVCRSPANRVQKGSVILLRVFFVGTLDVGGWEFFFVSYVIFYSKFNGKRISGLGPSVLEISRIFCSHRFTCILYGSLLWRWSINHDCFLCSLIFWIDWWKNFDDRTFRWWVMRVESGLIWLTIVKANPN